MMFLTLHFDLWPLTKSPSLMRQPILGIVWTAIVLALGALLYLFGTRILQMDVVQFLVRVPIPFIFGTIVVLNMLQNSLFGKLAQPTKGIANAVTAAVVGSALALLYSRLAPVVTSPLGSGPPAYESEIWLASALLSVTFPFLIYHAEFLGFWPLKSD
jgi:quinol-cytochrome oxidoreductase complex cytochrome b subunit